MTETGDTIDARWMKLALELAAQGEGFVEPNPMVGCVLVKDGAEIGRGFHRRFGEAHAEAAALRALDSPEQAKGATAYVTLEPCCHHGKTPPCSDALIEAGVARVVVAMKDPFPKVDGGGIGRLRSAGIDVQVGTLRDESRSLNAPYLMRLESRRPWVIAKWAMTIDGRIATVSGESQWISGPESRSHVHQLRGRVDAIAAGMGTVAHDDPMLNARPPKTDGGHDTPPRIAIRTLYCRNRLPDLESKLVRTAGDWPTRLFVADQISREQLSPWVDAGVECVRVEGDARQMVEQSLQLMGDQDMTNLMIEGGGELLGSFLGSPGQGSLIDECHVYIGPRLFGGCTASGPVGGPGIGTLQLTPQMNLIRIDRFGEDVRLTYRREAD